MWYGSPKTLTFRTAYKSRLHRARKSLQRIKLDSPLSNNYGSKNHYIHLPTSWNLTIVKNLKGEFKFLLTNNVYFFKVIFPNLNLSLTFDLQTHSVAISDRYFGNFLQFYTFLFRQVVSQFTSPTFLKLKFKGKGYAIYKNRRSTITSKLGHSHRIYIYSYFTTVKFLAKTSVIIFGLSKSDILITGYSIRWARPMNLFTGRGVRFNRQIVYRKTGKISTHR